MPAVQSRASWPHPRKARPSPQHVLTEFLGYQGLVWLPLQFDDGCFFLGEIRSQSHQEALTEQLLSWSTAWQVKYQAADSSQW